MRRKPEIDAKNNSSQKKMDSEMSKVRSKKHIAALSKARKLVYGTKSQRIAVLGAFDTWPYMDFVSRRVAKMGYIAVTSRYIYRFDRPRKFAREKIIRIDNTPDPGEFMIDFLQKLVLDCSHATILYSVSAGHFIETDWCYRHHINTLGIALVRRIGKSISAQQCSDLKVFPGRGYSLCKSTQTGFDCIKSGSCPFKEQGISKNVIEYFLRAPPSEMVLAAAENIDVISNLIGRWLRGTL